MESRPATTNDLDAVIELTRWQRRRLGAWCPVYFNPSPGADQAHALWIEILVGSDDHDTRVLDVDGDVVGFYHLVTQATRTWVDDLCLADDSLWPSALPSLAAVPRPWVTCVAVADEAGSSSLATIGAMPVSTYFTSPLEPADPALVDSPEIADFEPWAVEHTFGEGPFQPTTDGALVVIDDDGGYAVGSPSANPPIYDPGGPSCVVDTIRGLDRRALLLSAMRRAADRGDAQMIVPCGARDHDLRRILVGAGFEPQVDLLRGSRSR